MEEYLQELIDELNILNKKNKKSETDLFKIRTLYVNINLIKNSKNKNINLTEYTVEYEF